MQLQTYSTGDFQSHEMGRQKREDSSDIIKELLGNKKVVRRD